MVSPQPTDGDPATQKEVELSVVTSLYRSEEHVAEFCERVRACAAQITSSFEVILVNDGSPDSSLARGLDLIERYPEVRVVDLARHYGHYEALIAGLAEARGERIFLADCDLEEPPELLADLWREAERQGNPDCVYCVQARRRGGWFERWSGDAFYRAFNLLADLTIPQNTLVARLLTRRCRNALLALRERPVSFDAWFAAVGLRQVPLTAVKSQRRRQTSYPLSRRLGIAVDALIAYSGLLPKLLLILGTAVSTAAAVLGVALTAGVLTAAVRVGAWQWGMVAVGLVCGLLLFVGGLSGVYLYLILSEVRRRPTLVRQRYEQIPRTIEEHHGRVRR